MADDLPGEGHGHPFHDDLTRSPMPGTPPVEGAQWDELHQRWEHWDEERGVWVVVGDSGDGVDPGAETPYPSYLARELLRADDVEAPPPTVVDVERAPEPAERPEGAQWNELTSRWERWDEQAEAWVEVEG